MKRIVLASLLTACAGYSAFAHTFAAEAQGASQFVDPRIAAAVATLPAEWKTYVEEYTDELVVTGAYPQDHRHPYYIEANAVGYMQPRFKDGARVCSVYFSPESAAQNPAALATMMVHEATHCRQWRDGWYVGLKPDVTPNDLEVMAYDVQLRAARDIDARANREVMIHGGILHGEASYAALHAWFFWYYGQRGATVSYNERGIYALVGDHRVIEMAMPKNVRFIPPPPP